jgi:hypothetical protein
MLCAFSSRRWHAKIHLLETPLVSNRYSLFRKHRSPPRPPLLPRRNRIETRCTRCADFESLEPRALLAGTVLADYVVTQNWGSGFQAQITLTNQ